MSVVRKVMAVALTSDSLNNKQTGTAINFPTMGRGGGCLRHVQFWIRKLFKQFLFFRARIWITPHFVATPQTAERFTRNTLVSP